MTNVEFSIWLARELDENEPRQRFNIWSAVMLVGQDEAVKMLERAIEVYKSNKSCSLAAWWFVQLPLKAERATHRIRQGIREIAGLEPKSTPDIFI